MTGQNTKNPPAYAGHSPIPPSDPSAYFNIIREGANHVLEFLGELHRTQNGSRIDSTSTPMDSPPAYSQEDPTISTVRNGNSNETVSSQTHSQEELIGAVPMATDEFISQAPPEVTTQLANIGEKLAEISGKVCKNIKEKIFHVFETVAKCADKVIENPVLEKFVNSINDFIGKVAEKAKSVVGNAKELIGKFTSQVLSAAGRNNNQSRT